MSGLFKRGEIYHISKVVRVGNQKVNLQGSTGTGDLKLAEAILRKRITEVEQTILYGVRRRYTLSEGAAKLLEVRNDRNTIWHLDMLVAASGEVPLDELYYSEYDAHPSLAKFVQDRLENVSASTVNRSLEFLRIILNLAARKWHENGKTWIAEAGVVEMLPEDGGGGYPLSFGQQREFFARLPEGLKDIALFDVNTGLREGNLAALRWGWERRVGNILCFDIPTTKNDRPHRVVCNSVAREVVERWRGRDKDLVFGRKIHTTAWKRARKSAGLDNVRGPGKHFRVHDLRHTFSTRLREAGVPLEDRKDLLGHVNQDITTHYSAAETGKLLEYVERLVGMESEKPSIYIVNRTTNTLHG